MNYTKEQVIVTKVSGLGPDNNLAWQFVILQNGKTTYTNLYMNFNRPETADEFSKELSLLLNKYNA
jgi:hypothetical protein